MKRIIIAALSALTLTAQADEWTGRDKNIHFVGGALVSATVFAATGHEGYAFGAGVAAGLAKELYDTGGRGTVSFKDFAVTALGAYVGTKSAGWIISPTRIVYRMSF
jgi:uncharacterized protein YfiM (DUF2279 family)